MSVSSDHVALRRAQRVAYGVGKRAGWVAGEHARRAQGKDNAKQSPESQSEGLDVVDERRVAEFVDSVKCSDADL